MEKKIYDYLLSMIGNPYGVSGLMGNLFAESHLSPINLQNTYEKKLGMTDSTYTTLVDNGTYKNFATDSAGYGLAQWTSSGRKAGLFNFAKTKKTSIGNLDMQLEYLIYELNTSYKSVMSVLKTAKTVKQASDVVVKKFERPADQSITALKLRASYGQNYYNKYATQPAPSITKDIVQMNITKGNPEQFQQIIKNIKTALNQDFGLKFVLDSKIDEILLANLYNVVLSKNSNLYNTIYALTQLLKWWGYSIDASTSYDDKVVSIITLFQMQTGIRVSGTTTPDTWKKLLGK